VPRGPIGGATAALIRALAAYDVHVSRYQIERWRASGDLPRPTRRGLGRGRGVASDEPDEQTVQIALVLARGSRRGSRRVGVHVIERLAMGRPVPEADVRRAFTAALDELARMTGADLVDADAGWQARRAIAARAARDATPVGWQDLLAAVDGAPPRPDPPRDRKRAAAAGIIHALGGGDEALGEDLIEMVGLIGELTEEQAEEMRRAQRDAELRGEDPWGDAAEQMSVHSLRQVAATASLDRLRRATEVVVTVAAVQGMVVMLGLLDLAGSRIDLGERLNRFDTKMVRALQADPMWLIANTVRLSPKPRQRIRQLVLTALGILTAGNLAVWEAYRDRLLQLTYPDTPPA
jgi:hypothetical protein